MAVAAEDLVLDPTSEDATNVQLDLVDNSSYFLLAHAYPQPPQAMAWASSADSEGDAVANARYQNRTIDIQLRIYGSGADQVAAQKDLFTNKLGPLQQKIGKIQREGGTLKRVTPGGTTIVFDLLNEASIDITFDKRELTKSAATVALKFTAKPFGRGPVFQSFTDDFSSNTIANYTADAGATGNVSITGGVMQASANLTTNNRFTLTAGQSYTDFFDVQGTVKATLGTTLSGFLAGCCLKRKDASNVLCVYIDDNGTNSRLRIDKTVAGVTTNLASVNLAARLVVSTAYWVRGRIEGNTVYAEHFTSTPATATTAPANSTSYTLAAGAEQTTFGRGVSGKVGLTFTPQQAAASLDDFAVAPNTWVERTNPAVVGTAYGIQGDVPALGKLTLTNIDAAAIDQWFATWGVQSRYADQSATAALLYEAENLTAQGGSAVATRSGASPAGSASNNVMRNAALTSSYQSILSTQATGGGAQLSHVGDFQVFARVYDPGTTGSKLVTMRLDWTVGDFRSHTQNAEVQAPVTGAFSLVDLGQVHIPNAVVGAQRWEGRILAKTSGAAGDAIEIDCLIIVPITEGSGRATGIQQFENPTTLNARDEFNQAAGNLQAVALPVGGSWSTGAAAGLLEATDFAVETTGHTATRSNAGNTLGRYAVAGTPVLTGSLVQIDVKVDTTIVTTVYTGVIARWVDASNFLRAVLDISGGRLRVEKLVAGVPTALANVLLSSAPVKSTFYTVRLSVDPAGRWYTWFGLQGGTLSMVASGQDTVLATGGTLASGKLGMSDANGGGGTPVRNFDNFFAAAINADAAIYSGRTLEVRNDRTIRQDSGGTYYVSVAKYEGDYLLVPPAGREARTSRFTAKGVRNDYTTMADTAIDDLQAQLSYTPRFLVVPE